MARRNRHGGAFDGSGSPRDRRSNPSPHEREIRAERLKERIYLTFAALAVVLALNAHGHVEAVDALKTLTVTVFGTLLAVFTADIVSSIVVRERMLTWAEVRHAASTSFGALPAVALPFIFIGLAALDVWYIESALHGSTIALIVALVVIGLAAVRKLTLRWWERLIALGAEAALGLAVIALQLLAHS